MKYWRDILGYGKKIIYGIAAVVIILGIFAGYILLSVPATGSAAGTSQKTVGILYSKGVGPMPQLLATNQVGGYIAWQPYVQIAPQAGIGKIVSYSGALPPAGTWKNHPTNVFVSRDDFVAQNPDLVNALAALTIASDQYITDHPKESAAITADWLFAKGNLTFGNVSVSSVDTMNMAITAVTYTTNPSDDWIAGTKKFIATQIEFGYVTGKLKNSTADQQNSILFNFDPYNAAKKELDAKQIVTPPVVNSQIGFGYLNAADHAALFVAVKNWQYFSDTYGIALKPQDLTKAEPDLVDLIVNGKKVATLKLIPADARPQLMQLTATNSIQADYVGVPPAIATIDHGNPIHILSPIDTEGSGLVVATTSPASDWQSFVAWVGQRSSEGKPLKIAAPGKGSIQDVMLRVALDSSGFTIKEMS